MKRGESQSRHGLRSQEIREKRKHEECNLGYSTESNTLSCLDQVAAVVRLRRLIDTMPHHIEIQYNNQVDVKTSDNDDARNMLFLERLTQAQNPSRAAISGTIAFFDTSDVSGMSGQLPLSNGNGPTVPKTPVPNNAHTLLSPTDILSSISREDYEGMENRHNMAQNPFKSTFYERVVIDDFFSADFLNNDFSFPSTSGFGEKPPETQLSGNSSIYLIDSPLRDITSDEEHKSMENIHNSKKLCIEKPQEPKEPIFTCPVCHDQFVNATSTICGHIFCESCIQTEIKIRKKCPLCQRKLTSRKNQIHRVYLPAPDY